MGQRGTGRGESPAGVRTPAPGCTVHPLSQLYPPCPRPSCTLLPTAPPALRRGLVWIGPILRSWVEFSGAGGDASTCPPQTPAPSSLCVSPTPAPWLRCPALSVELPALNNSGPPPRQPPPPTPAPCKAPSQPRRNKGLRGAGQEQGRRLQKCC